MLRCFIADDEALARQRLRYLFEAEADVSIVGEAADGVTTLEQVALSRPDVLLLDIQMPELDGLGVAAALRGGDGPLIIFVTAYDEHALAAFELSALDYLVKPVNPERLAAALARARKVSGAAAAPATAERRDQGLALLLEKLSAAHAPRRMAVRSGSKFIVFDPATVYGVFARDHYSCILLEGRELLADDPLEQLEQRFASIPDGTQFVRVHRGAIINLTRLRELVREGDRRYVAVLSDSASTRVPVSRERLGTLKAALGLD
jgi:two-component system LytT family response regulator